MILFFTFTASIVFLEILNELLIIQHNKLEIVSPHKIKA